MKQQVMAALDGVGLGEAARHAKRGLRSVPDRLGIAAPLRRLRERASEEGWARWTPLVPEAAFETACHQAIARLRAEGPDEEIGDYLEFGVSRGTSFACMHRALVRAGLDRVRMFGFDSFEGLPPEAGAEGWRPGEFRSSIGATQRYLNRAGLDWTRASLIPGWFRDTLKDGAREALGLHKASLIMMDCDIHAATSEALAFSAPLIRDRAVMFLDDWDMDPNGQGQKRAFGEFLRAHPEFSATPLPAYIPAARVFLITRSN